MSKVNLNNEDLKNLIVNILLADKWQVRSEQNEIFVSTKNLVDTEMPCSIIDVKKKTVTLNSHRSWNHISFRSIDSIRGAIRDFEIKYKNL